MSYSFREEYPVLGPNTSVDMTGGASGFGPGQLVKGPKVPAYHMVSVALSATSVSQTAFLAPLANNTFGQYKFEYATVTFGTQSTSGTLQIEKATGTQAIGGGTNLLQATLALSGTANTPTDSSGSAAPVANPNTLTLAGGDRVNLIIAGTMTGLANAMVTLVFSRV